MAVSESVFGRIVVESDIDSAVMHHLRDWMPTYIREIERQMEMTMGKIPPPRTYTRRNRFDTYPEDQNPLAIVISPGLVGEDPAMDGEGWFNCWFGLGIGLSAMAASPEAADMVVKVQVAAARAIMLQKQNIGGLIQGVHWLDVDYIDVPVTFDDAKYVRMGRLAFRVYVEQTVNRYGGPATPDPPDPEEQPGSQWPVANIVDVDVEVVNINESVRGA